MWEVWNRSQAFRTRPSELAGIFDPIRAFYFDRGVSLFGQHVEMKVEAAGQSSKGKKRSESFIRMSRQAVLDKYLGATEAQKAKRFRDPAINVGGTLPGLNGDSGGVIPDGKTEVEVGLSFLG